MSKQTVTRAAKFRNGYIAEIKFTRTADGVKCMVEGRNRNPQFRSGLKIDVVPVEALDKADRHDRALLKALREPKYADTKYVARFQMAWHPLARFGRTEREAFAKAADAWQAYSAKAFENMGIKNLGGTINRNY